MSWPQLIRHVLRPYHRDMSIPVLESDYCFAARRAARHISQLYEKHLAQAYVTPNQFSILCALNLSDSMTMAELAQAMLLDRTTLVRTLQPLLRESLVDSTQRPGSARALRYAITASGSERVRTASVHWLAAQREFEAQFGELEAGSLRTDLLRMTNHVSRS
jgi:DNA-binding MarR family transcriptional regulator